MEFKRPLKLLAIGNSFSDDTMKFVGYIMKDMGISDFSLGNLYVPGCTLDKHYDNAMTDAAVYEFRTTTDGEWITKKETPLKEALAYDDWEFISMQQQSDSHGRPETFGHLDDMISYVQEHCPKATLLWNMTWALSSDSERAQFDYYDRDQMKMYNAITKTVQSLIVPKSVFKAISPVGTTIQNLRTSYMGDTLNRDGLHLTYHLGRFAAGLTFFKALTGMDIDRCNYKPEDVTDQDAAAIKEAVNNAIKNPFAVTASSFKD